MGIAYADVTLANVSDIIRSKLGEIKPEDVRKVQIHAMVDSGSTFLAINETIRNQLGLPITRTTSCKLADGSLMEMPVVPGIKIYFENREAECEAVVFPGDTLPLLGALAMEAMDTVIEMRTGHERLVVNPEHPDRPQYMLK